MTRPEKQDCPLPVRQDSVSSGEPLWALPELPGRAGVPVLISRAGIGSSLQAEPSRAATTFRCKDTGLLIPGKISVLLCPRWGRELRSVNPAWGFYELGSGQAKRLC